MAQLVKIAKKSDIENGKIKEYTVSGKSIAIANTEGDFFAFDALCTHAHCSLAGGFLDGYTLTCYCHGAQFDISKGDVISPPATEPLGIYKVKVEGEDILVEI